MYKVLIIDDEPKVRKGLTRLIPEFDSEWVVVGEARNGKEGLEKVESYQPDLVITDIRMPKMNGLDLLNVLRTYSVYVVVLSGYGYFEYAQTAIKFGAFDYLLKPTKPEEIKDVLSRIKEKLQESTKTAWNNESILDYSLLWKEWLLDMNPSEEPPALLCKRLQVMDCPYHVVIIEIDDIDELVSEDKWGDRQLLLFAVKNIISDFFGKENASECFFMYSQGGQLFYLLNGQNFVTKTVPEWIVLIKRWLEISISVGVSAVAETIEDIPLALAQAREALQNKWIYGSGSCCFFTDFRIDDVMSCGYPIQLEESLLVAIRGCRLDKALEIFDHFINKLTNPQTTFRVFRRSYLQLATAIIRIMYEYKIYDLLLKELQPFDLVEQHYSINEVSSKMKNIIAALIEAIEFSKSAKMERTIKNALEYIHEHYIRDLSLDEVSHRVQMSPGYFSTFFKQEMGTTFVDYMTRLRIDKAKQIMSDSRIKLYEVSEMVGYSDCKYFSRVFKRIVGVSPAEYREFFFRKEEG